MLYSDINLQKRTQQNTTRYRTALYLRLSREDGDKTESDSIANQSTLLEAYTADHPELCIVDEFVDDGYSGSNFERPAFQNLFRELEQGIINCVLVKDLSRFGRNYIEVGRYLERIFPVMRVRLIAVTDNYDSQSAWKTSDSIMVPMRNLLNDAYCRDISVKIKSQLAVKRKRGDFVGSFATYGYQKDPSNHTKLIVDELAAENVQSVFRWKISGMSNQGIADRLNAGKVPSPATRKLQSGAKLSLHFRKSDEPPWSAKAVDRILHNEVYTGKLVQGKTRRLDYRSKKKMNVPMRDWTMLNKPAVSIKYGVMKFNMACIRLFEGIKYVLPILHPNKKRLALIMCPEEDSASVEWARQKDENWVNKDITSLEFVENIFKLMNWNRECRYKVLGRVANSDQGLCMLFDLEEAIMFTPKPQEYADPLTGEMKKKQMKFFPDTYRNRIGKSYNDYIADHQMNMFEDFIGYQGSAVLDEPVREEDSFSKESMSQESEISENILLPDLAKQSESIEQQSGEIAERGMPT